MFELDNMLHSVGEQLASYPAGQYLFRTADQTLQVLEKSAQWFIEPEDLKGPHVRPLPWVLFLPVLIWLRTVKVAADITMFFKRRESVEPAEIVRFIQMQRRRLRAIKYAGLKNLTTVQESEEGKGMESTTDEDEKPAQNETELQQTDVPSEKLNISDHNSDCDQNVEESSEDGKQEDQQFAQAEADIKQPHITLEALESICKDYQSDEDPDFDPKMHGEEESEDVSNTSTSSTSSTLSLKTAEARSDSGHTYYSSCNVSPEPVETDASVKNFNDNIDLNKIAKTNINAVPAPHDMKFSQEEKILASQNLIAAEKSNEHRFESEGNNSSQKVINTDKLNYSQKSNGALSSNPTTSELIKPIKVSDNKDSEVKL